MLNLDEMARWVTTWFWRKTDILRPPKVEILQASGTAGLRLYGTTPADEIADLYVGTTGQLVLSTTAGGDTGGYIELRPEDNDFGVVVRESDGTGQSVYANFYVVDASDDYLSINISAGAPANDAAAALIVTANKRVGINILQPTVPLEVGGVVKATGLNLGNETMSVYNEGTWTPVITGSVADPDTLTYTTQTGKYTQIGDVVFYHGRIVINAYVLGAGSGDARFSLPGTVGTYDVAGSVRLSGPNTVASTVGLSFASSPGNAYGLVRQTRDDTTLVNLDLADLAAGDIIAYGGFYFA
jgi:hypothetical protein